MARGVSRHVRLSRQRAPHAWATACAVVLRVTGVSGDPGPGPGRRGRQLDGGASYARQLALYVAVVAFDVNALHAAEQAGLHKQTAQFALAKLEKARDDDPLLEDLLETLVALAQTEGQGRAAA